MSPTHSNKLGVRYRYYVSHAFLQNRKEEAGSVTRVPAPEIEHLVLDGVRRHLETTGLPGAVVDRDLIERHVDRVIVRPQAVEVRVMSSRSTEPVESGGDEPSAGEPTTTTLTLPWMAPSFIAVKGIVHEPAGKPVMSPETRDALLGAIAKARGWIEDLRLGRVATLAEIADREGLGDRHVRLLAPLAFVAPRVVGAIADGTASADLTVTGLAKTLSHSWAEQEQRFAAAGPSSPLMASELQ
jgi:site-specific DNA recombinase